MMMKVRAQLDQLTAACQPQIKPEICPETADTHTLTRAVSLASAGLSRTDLGLVSLASATHEQTAVCVYSNSSPLTKLS